MVNLSLKIYLWILRVVFLVGTTEEPELQERIDRESSTYMDIVQVSAQRNSQIVTALKTVNGIG